MKRINIGNTILVTLDDSGEYRIMHSLFESAPEGQESYLYHKFNDAIDLIIGLVLYSAKSGIDIETDEFKLSVSNLIESFRKLLPSS
jgi:hypothetical protein